MHNKKIKLKWNTKNLPAVWMSNPAVYIPLPVRLVFRRSVDGGSVAGLGWHMSLINCWGRLQKFMWNICHNNSNDGALFGERNAN